MYGLKSLMKENSDTGTDMSPDDISTIDEIPEDIILSRQTSVNLVPIIGQRFISQDAAYEFYCSFAKQCGFSIRRHRTRGKDGVGRGITRRDFTCHRGGYPQIKPEDKKSQRNRKSSRCGCQAYMRIVKRADFDVPEWRITCFSNVHNHELLKLNEVHLLPSYCTISVDDKSRICMFSKAGMCVRQMMRLMELEKGVKLGCLPFTEVDVRSLLQSFRIMDKDNDPIHLLSMCKEKKDRDPEFKYEFKIDANNRLENIAWSYSSSVWSYEAFGDVVVFDTTHRIEAYDMIFGTWIGIDNHGMHCFFGCVLLRAENVQSFSWALKAFLNFMNKKAPETILTDQNVWLKEALAIEMPRTRHSFCVWHIISRFYDWFSALLGSQYDKWRAEFRTLYNLYTVEEFEVGWREMVNAYGLHGNKHIISLYALRTYWALPFLRCYFFAGMTSSFPADSINVYIQRLISSQSASDNFIEQMATLVEFKDAGNRKKMQQKLQKLSLKTGSPIESHAANVLTPYAFSKLQEELLLAPQYASLVVDQNYFIARHHTKMDGGSKVIWAPHDDFISCSCHQFEFSGILCRHVLRVLSTNNCFHIPDRYLPTRWRDTPSPSIIKLVHNLTSGHYGVKFHLFQSIVSNLVTESVATEERLDFSCDQVSLLLTRIKNFPGSSLGANELAYNSQSDSLVLLEAEDSDDSVQSFSSGNAQESMILENLGERRSREGVDMYRKRKCCPVPCCWEFGHDASDCPMTGGDDLSTSGLGFYR